MIKATQYCINNKLYAKILTGLVHWENLVDLKVVINTFFHGSIFSLSIFISSLFIFFLFINHLQVQSLNFYSPLGRIEKIRFIFFFFTLCYYKEYQRTILHLLAIQMYKYISALYNSLIMTEPVLSQYNSFFQPIISTYQDQEDPILISDHLSLKSDGTSIVRVQITKSSFTIFIPNLLSGQEDSSCQRAIIDFDLKFQQLLSEQLPMKNKQHLRSSRKIGFCLSKRNFSQKISFYHSDRKVLQKWLEVLKSLINELGFHHKYTPIKIAGRGQFASVYQVKCLETSRYCAVKGFCKSTLEKLPKGMQTLKNQIKIMRNLCHKNLQRLYCVCESENSIYLVTEYLPGGTLLDRIQKKILKKKVISFQETRQCMIGLLEGLKELALLNIVHRDIKLDNILLRDCNSFEPVIIDFGLATYSHENEYIYSKCGTPGYVSPEILSENGKKIKPISDMFSLGVIFNYLLTNQPLFKGGTVAQIFQNNKQFKFHLQEEKMNSLKGLQGKILLNKMLEKNTQERISAEKALQNEFFQQSVKLDNAFSVERLREYIEQSV